MNAQIAIGLFKGHEKVKFIIDGLGEVEYKTIEFKEVVELLQAKADGRLVELPCKVGDAVYRLLGTKKHGRYVGKRTAHGIAFFANGSIVIYSTSEDILGKTVFLTREEAEKAVREAAK